MSEVEILLPKLGESIVSATVIQWLKKEGDVVVVDDPIVEVATDKVNSEIPSPYSGTLVRCIAAVDEVVEVGAALAVIETADSAQTSEIPRCGVEPAQGGAEASSGFLSPAVLRLAQEKGISVEQLEQMKGSGRGGRVTKRDVESYKKGPQITLEEGDERRPMSPMRRAIADAMVRSKREAPHAYLVREIDMTDTLKEIRETREAFKKEHGSKLTLTSYLLRAIGRAAKIHSEVNAVLDGGDIVVRGSVNIGIAVEVPDGLLVPVVRSCHEKDLPRLATELADLAMRAREGRLEPNEVQGGTITLTNFGMSGAAIGFPILRAPETAIIGVGALTEAPRVVDGQVVVRNVMQVTLGFDHRTLDGMAAGAFLKEISDQL